MKIGKREYCFVHAQPWQRGFWKDRISPSLLHIGIGFAIITVESIDT